jgi:hypothetical protein
VQVPHGSRPARGLDIICVDTPSGKVAEKSSFYDLSIFPSEADPECAEIVAVASGCLSLSIGDLCLDIDKLDEIRREDMDWILFVWIRLVAKLLKSLVFMIYPFFLLKPIPSVPRLLQLRPEVRV